MIHVTRRVPTVLGLLVLAGVAGAAPKRKVKIESDPPGATIYFNAKEDGPVCTTPCTVNAPAGETSVIVELENHKPLFENLVVKGKKPITVKYKLVPAIGTLVVKGPSGARILVDDVDKGKAPTSFAVPAGSHTVILMLDGKNVGTEFVDVASNEEVTVEGKAVASVEDDPEDDVVVDDGDGGGGGDTTTSVSTSGGITRRKTRDPYIALAVAVDVGFRNFEYEMPLTDNLSTEKEGGQVLVGPILELWPGRLAGIELLRGLSLLARFGYGVNQQAVKQTVSMTTTSAKTYWQALEISLRQRWSFKDKVAVEVGGGFVRDLHSFSGNVADIDLVPDVDYRSIRLGGRLAALLGSIEPYVSGENRLVLSGGNLAKRFDDASAGGVRASVGAVATFGAVHVRVEGALNRYSWSFTSNDADDEFRASGGIDSIIYLTGAIGYAY